MSTTSPAVPAVDKKDQSDISVERITKLTEPVNDGFTMTRTLYEQLMVPLSGPELMALDPFAGLRRLNTGERQHAINAYWRKNNHISIGETIVNVLLFTIIMWIMAFLMSLGLLVLWK